MNYTTVQSVVPNDTHEERMALIKQQVLTAVHFDRFFGLCLQEMVESQSDEARRKLGPKPPEQPQPGRDDGR